MVCTLIGVLPRIFILSLFGASIMKYKMLSLLIVAAVLIVFFAFKLVISRRALKNETMADN
jgi:uncharacterized membrane protein YdjX (TVP38/TMEM64 family)